METPNILKNKEISQESTQINNNNNNEKSNDNNLNNNKRPSRPWNNFREYFSAKKSKLKDQFLEQSKQVLFHEGINESQSRNLIFHNITFFLSGDYNLPALSKLIHLNGGLVEQHPTRAVSYIVSSKIPLNIRQNWIGKNFVYPVWIENCIKNGRLLKTPEDGYLGILTISNWVHISKTTFERNKIKNWLSISNDKGKEKEINDQHKLGGISDNTLSSGSKEKPTYKKAVIPSIPKTDDPDFLPTFFENSRLHHLSTWKQELFQHVRDELPDNKPISDSVTNNPIFAQAKLATSREVVDDEKYLWFHIDMDCFFATASLLNHPELKDKPVAVCHTKSGIQNSTSEIASCNYPARAFNIGNGTFLGSALKKCPSLTILDYDFPLYKSISWKFYSILINTVKSLDGYLMPCSLDELYIQVSKETLIERFPSASEDIYESSTLLGVYIRNKIETETSCTCSIGIGINRFVARVATSLAKPNGLKVIPKQNLRENLIKLNKLSNIVGLGYSKIKSLNQSGINNIEDLYKISKQKLISLLGVKSGSQIFDFLRGIDNRIDNSWKQLVNTMSINVNWGIRLDSDEAMYRFVDNFTDELKKKLESTKNVWAEKMTLCIKVKEPGTDTYKFLGMGICYDCNYSYNLQDKDWDYIRSAIKSASHKASHTEKGTGHVDCLRGYNCTFNKLIKSRKQLSLPNNKEIQKNSIQTIVLPDTNTKINNNFFNERNTLLGICSTSSKYNEQRLPDIQPKIVLRNLHNSIQTDLDWDWDWNPNFNDAISIPNCNSNNSGFVNGFLSNTIDLSQMKLYINDNEDDDDKNDKKSKISQLKEAISSSFKKHRTDLDLPN